MLFGDPQFAGRYGFGALRCAIDDLNGDNVETIQFPSGTRHMYCYAYYVTPPPSSGTIIIRKQVVGAEAPESFRFTGNVSYNVGGVFDLSASSDDPDSIEFPRGETRAGETPWTVVEDAKDGWTLTDLTCTSASSPTVTNVAARSVQITLVAGDTVTCTYTNRLTPPAGALVLRKVTVGGVGSFPFSVSAASGRVAASPTLRTTQEGGLGAVTTGQLDAGSYRISERRPATDLGTWRLSGVSCNGESRDPSDPVTVNITGGSGAICTFTNRLDRPGAIAIDAVSIGGLGTAGYIVTPAGDATVQRRKFATTRRQATAADAVGQSTQQLPFGRYVIQQTATPVSPRTEWTLIAVTCNGELIPFEQGRVTVRISRGTPEQDCRFINLRQREPGPPPPDPDDPDPETPTDPDSPTPEPGAAEPDLALVKRQTASTGGRLPTLTFRLTVTNRSAVAATRVVVADRLAAGTVFVSARPDQGSCAMRATRLLVCALGDIAAGEDVDITVRVQQIDPRAGLNVAVVGAGSPETVLRNNLAAARVSPVRIAPPRACPSGARIAC